MGAYLQRASDGKRLRDPADGKRWRHGETAKPCCCGEPDCGGTPCEYCGDCTPAAVDVTFSAVAVPTTCVDGSNLAGESRKAVVGSVFSGTFTLSQTGPCLWELDTAYSAIVVNTYGVTGCGGAVVLTTDRLKVQVARNSGSWVVGAELSGLIDGLRYTALVLFTATIAASDCSTVVNGSNSYTDFGDGISAAHGKDGTATLP